MANQIPIQATFREALGRAVDARKRVARAALARSEGRFIEGDEESLEGEGIATLPEPASESGSLLEGGGASLTPSGI